MSRNSLPMLPSTGFLNPNFMNIDHNKCLQNEQRLNHYKKFYPKNVYGGSSQVEFFKKESETQKKFVLNLDVVNSKPKIHNIVEIPREKMQTDKSVDIELLFSENDMVIEDKDNMIDLLINDTFNDSCLSKENLTDEVGPLNLEKFVKIDLSVPTNITDDVFVLKDGIDQERKYPLTRKEGLMIYDPFENVDFYRYGIFENSKKKRLFNKIVPDKFYLAIVPKKNDYLFCLNDCLGLDSSYFNDVLVITKSRYNLLVFSFSENRIKEGRLEFFSVDSLQKVTPIFSTVPFVKIIDIIKYKKDTSLEEVVGYCLYPIIMGCQHTEKGYVLKDVPDFGIFDFNYRSHHLDPYFSSKKYQIEKFERNNNDRKSRDERSGSIKTKTVYNIDFRTQLLYDMKTGKMVVSMDNNLDFDAPSYELKNLTRLDNRVYFFFKSLVFLSRNESVDDFERLRLTFKYIFLLGVNRLKKDLKTRLLLYHSPFSLCFYFSRGALSTIYEIWIDDDSKDSSERYHDQDCFSDSLTFPDDLLCNLVKEFKLIIGLKKFDLGSLLITYTDLGHSGD